MEFCPNRVASHFVTAGVRRQVSAVDHAGWPASRSSLMRLVLRLRDHAPASLSTQQRIRGAKYGAYDSLHVIMAYIAPQ